MSKPIPTLEFTPLEFETTITSLNFSSFVSLEFTPLEFETDTFVARQDAFKLEFTPLEFETFDKGSHCGGLRPIRIYSVGV